jgi:hypothetical protein
MREPRKRIAPKSPAAAKKEAKRPAENPRLAAQTRKILGKHYANKYRVR